MCCLFGMIDTSNNFTGKQKSRIIHALAMASEERGTDAAGIAYHAGGKLHINKKAVPGHRLRVRIPDDAVTVMGHTRLATQGDAARAYNNHPFLGAVNGEDFALAHNGVLYNDSAIRKTLKLPKTKIETDSYVAVQVLEQKNAVSFDSLRYMAKQIDGTFVFTVLDSRDNLYFVRGNNPLCIYYYARLGLYLYASTESILRRAISDMRVALGRPERVPLDEGDILRIDAYGKQAWSTFNIDRPNLAWGLIYDRYDYYDHYCGPEPEYIEALKMAAAYYGYHSDLVDNWLEAGYTGDEIEQLIYEGEL